MSEINLTNFDPPSEKGKDTLYSRLAKTVGRIFRLSQSSPPEVKQLDGRVEAMRLKVERTLAHLNVIKLEWEVTLDDELFSHVVSVIDPLIRDLKRIQQLPSHETLNHFENWVDRAMKWVALWDRPLEREAIVAAVIEHSISDAVNSVERDIRVIQVYLRHRIDGLKIHVEEKEKVEQHLKEKIKPFFEKLRKLTHQLEVTTLEELSQLKNLFNEEREIYHESALNTIDTHIKKI